MGLQKLVRRNYGEKLLVSIKYQNLYSFKEGVILLCQSILKMRRITHFHRSSLFTILLKTKEMIKDYVIIMIKKYNYVPSVPNSVWL